MTELPQRLPASDYPNLHHVLDDVHVCAFWVQRSILPWLKGTPDNEVLELGYVLDSLASLGAAVEAAKGKVDALRRVAVADRDEWEAEAFEATS